MPTTTTPVGVGDRFINVYQRVRKVAEEHLGTNGVSFARTKTLHVIDTDGPIRLRSIADRLEYAPASVTDMIDGLERDGLAKRLPDPSDRRACLVTITDAGREALTAARARRNDILDAIFGVLGEEERVTFMGALDTLAYSPILNGEHS